LKCDGTRAETRFRFTAKRTSPFKSAWASVQSTTSSRGVRISGNNAGYTMFRGCVRVLATHSIRQSPLHFPSRTSPCAITFQLGCTTQRWLPTPFASFPFTSPLVRHRVPSHFNWTLQHNAGYPLHSPVSPSLPLPCFTLCHHISTGLYNTTLATHSIRQFPLHFPSRASPCAITFQLDSTTQRSLPTPFVSFPFTSPPVLHLVPSHFNWTLQQNAGYPLHSPVSPSLPLPCVTVCHHISTGLYNTTLATHSIRQFHLHSPPRLGASPCAITFQLDSTSHPETQAAGCFQALVTIYNNNFCNKAKTI